MGLLLHIRISEGIMRILLDFQTGLGYPWRVSQAHIALCATRFGRCDLEFSRTSTEVVLLKMARIWRGEPGKVNVGNTQISMLCRPGVHAYFSGL